MKKVSWIQTVIPAGSFTTLQPGTYRFTSGTVHFWGWLTQAPTQAWTFTAGQVGHLTAPANVYAPTGATVDRVDGDVTGYGGPIRVGTSITLDGAGAGNIVNPPGVEKLIIRHRDFTGLNWYTTQFDPAPPDGVISLGSVPGSLAFASAICYW